MTTQNLFHANPNDPTNTGFYFTDLESYRAEYEHFGPAQYELRIIAGDQIDLELFAGLKITSTNLAEWFTDIQFLTYEEKVGLWFLVCRCGFSLTSAQEIILDGMTIYHGTKQAWTKEWLEQSGDNFMRDGDGSVQEFRLGGDTWCAGSVGY
jgi:hypothetical protein